MRDLTLIHVKRARDYMDLARRAFENDDAKQGLLMVEHAIDTIDKVLAH